MHGPVYWRNNRLEKMTINCPFCQIAAGELPATIVYQDDEIIAFRDIHPTAPTHILLIPRKHIVSIAKATEQDATLLGKLLLVAALIAEQENLDRGFRLVTNTGIDGGQSVHHLHVHLIGGRRMGWPPG